MKRLVLPILTLLALAGCAPYAPAGTREADFPVGIRRFVDAEAQVVCWYYGYEGGLSCLPLADTALKEGR